MIQESQFPAYSSYITETQGAPATSNFDVSSLGKDDFLKLLLAELKHQDPLNPADNTEFVAQLAQFSSLEQMTTMNTNLEKTLENNTMMADTISNAMMINYFGKIVSAETDSFMYDGQNDVKLQFILDRALSSGVLEIIDGNGTTVRTIPLDSLSAGLNKLEWNGITNLGALAPSGQYSYTITAKDILGERVEISPVFSGVVDGISYRDGTAYLNVGGVLIPFDSIAYITEEK
ncbi:MAG TPA: flagellar hook assembly protein FlgD [Anaerolineae bacterium]|nr:flagellar hook assembly protein FlgD [Anaerolineae bacterium]